MKPTRLVRVGAGVLAAASLFGCSDAATGPRGGDDSGGAGGSSGSGASPGTGGSSAGTGGTSGGAGGSSAGTGGSSAGGTSGGAGGSSAGAGGSSAGSGGTSIGGTGGTSPTTGSDVSFDGTRIRARITALQVPPGGEQHVCVTLELPNPNAVWVGEINATLTGGSHHLIVDRRPPGTPVLPNPEVCPPTMGGENSRLIIAQQTQTSVKLPQGVAFPVEARQGLFLQLHYFNSGSAVRNITGEVEFVLANTSSGTPIEAKSIFTGTLSINLQPLSEGSSQGFFPVRGTTGTRHVFALTSHTHKLGTLATIERVPNAASPATTPIHESRDWSEPPLSQFSPPLTFNGNDGLRLKCNYNNTTNAPVGFGTGVDQEMCFMWVYYYDR